MSIYGAEGFHGIIYGAEEFLGAPNLVPIMPRDLNLQTFHLNIHPCFFSFFHPHKYYIYIYFLFSLMSIFSFFFRQRTYIYIILPCRIYVFFFGKKYIHIIHIYLFIFEAEYFVCFPS